MFKFSKFDNYSLENLEKGQIWCNYFESFNDPYECWCIEKTGIPDPVKEKERYDSIVAAWGYDPGSSKLEEYYEYIGSFEGPYAMRVGGFIESARISCFCKNPDNLLMWSHYGDGLRGFCIEFDKDKVLDDNSGNAGIYQVVYDNVPPIVDTMLYEVAKDQIWYHEMVIEEEEEKILKIKNHTPDELLPEFHIALKNARALQFELYYKMLCYKPAEWQYEEEIRLIYHTGKTDKIGYPYKYPKIAIKSIIIGEKAANESVNELKNIIYRNNIYVPIKVASRVKGSYKIELS